jgi:SAM-dependent methyltransferase
VIYGQDADGLAHGDRVEALRECHRVLRPGGVLGFHLWLLGLGTAQSAVNRFDEVTAEAGYSYMRRLSAAAAVEDLQAAGFAVTTEDMSDTYETHLRALRDRALAEGASLDPWTTCLLNLIEEGVPVGARFVAEKLP